MLRLLLVADHQLGLLSFDLLQGALFLSDSVCIVQRGNSCLLLVLLHVLNDGVHFTAARQMSRGQKRIRVSQSCVTRIDLLQVCELVLESMLHILQEGLVLLQLLNLFLNSVVLRLQRL